MPKEKYNLYTETSQLVSKEDLRVTRLFWFTMGVLVAVVFFLILISTGCIAL